MYCSKCGAQNRDEAQFCDSCGAPLQQQAGPQLKLPAVEYWRRRAGFGEEEQTIPPMAARNTEGIGWAILPIPVTIIGLISVIGVLVWLLPGSSTQSTAPSGQETPAVLEPPAAFQMPEPTPQPPSLQISSVKCTATLFAGSPYIHFDIHITGSRIGTNVLSETILAQMAGNTQYPLALRSSLSSTDGQTIFADSAFSVPEHLAIGQKFEATDQLLYSPANPRRVRRTGAPGIYSILEPEGCSGSSCIGGVLHADCYWRGQGDP
jgi:hypothetical protein